MQVLITTLISGLVAGISVVVVQHLFVWRYQRRLDLMRHVFDETVAAISMYEIDAMDHLLQENNKPAMGIKPRIALRSETKVSLSKADALIQAMFRKETHNQFKKLLGAGLNVSNPPNDPYYKQLDKFMPMLAKEVDPPSWWYR